jgi:hypothetical protein
MTAVVSEMLHPIAVCRAENKDMRMSVLDWGFDARSRITGKPMSFTMWIMDQIMRGLTSGEKKED